MCLDVNDCSNILACRACLIKDLRDSSFVGSGCLGGIDLQEDVRHNSLTPWNLDWGPILNKGPEKRPILREASVS